MSNRSSGARGMNRGARVFSLIERRRAKTIAQREGRKRWNIGGRPLDDTHFLSVVHEHTCITPTCRSRYACGQKCDPKKLRDSICGTCLIS